MKKIVSIVLIIMITCFYVNTAFGTEVTEDSFYNTLKSLRKVAIKSWSSDAPSYEDASVRSSSSRTYDDEIVRTTNGIEYYYSFSENGEKIKLFSTEYTIDSNIFKVKSHVDAGDIQNLIKDEEEEWLYLGIIIVFSQLPTDYIIVLSDLLGVKPENAYGYYAENISTGEESEDPRGIIKSKFINAEDYMDLDLEIDLEKFAKIDSTYLNGEYSYEITIDKNNENQVSDKNEIKDENDVEHNTTNTQNENKSNNTNTNKAQNENTNRNTNTNQNTNRNVNNNQNSNTINTNVQFDNTVSENKLPNAGVAKTGLVIIAVSLIGIYSYKKYVDYNKMF